MDPKQVKKLVLINDNEARRALFEAFYRRTYAVVYHVLRSHENAEDVTQDAFIKAFERLHQLNDQEKFAAWLAVIATNLAKNYLKRQKKIVITDTLPESTLNEELADTENEAMRNLEREKVRRAIDKLSPEQYAVIVLYYYDDLKVEEIALMLKTRPGTVKSRLFRARKKIAAELELVAASNGHH